MFCTNCGSIIPEGAKFCTNCGAAVPAAESISEPVAPETPEEKTVQEVSGASSQDTSGEAAAAGAVFAADAQETAPAAPKPQGTWYDQPYTMSQNQVNEGNYNYNRQQQTNNTDPNESVKNPSFGEAISSFFTHYIDFKGRSSRAEYWYVVLASYLIDIVFAVLIGITKSAIFSTIEVFYYFLVFIPSLAIWFRRLHDTGRSGWYIFVMLLPIVGWILMIIWLCSGSDGGNIYGPEPKMK
ncbi:MAG: DUF805 domain-containing protein [Clostridia bacterium]|nr:DUF805 domain-containing protein [Clostridia bacterium]